MSKKTRKTNEIPEGFTLAMAAVDAIPVLFFCASALLIAKRFDNALFLTGAALCAAAGVGKVLYKVLIAAAKKVVPILSRQLRVLMPLGFLLMIIAALTAGVDWVSVWNMVSRMPSAALFLLGIAGMVLMSVFAKKLDSASAKANWIEQCTNAAAQGCFLLGIILMK